MEWLLLAVSALLILACGGFVAAEFSFVTVDRATVDQNAAAGKPGALGVQRALQRLSTQLSGAQVGITVTNLAIGFLAEPAIAEIIARPMRALGVPEGSVSPLAIAIGLVLSTVMTMIFGELIPKNLAIAMPYRTALGTQRFMRTFTKINAIPIRMLNGGANTLVRRFGVEPQEELRSARSGAELASLVQRSADQGTLDSETAELLERSWEFGNRAAGEIMTPRVRATTLNRSDRAIRIIEEAKSTGHSRFPVLDEEDAVVGTAHVKHVVGLSAEERANTKLKSVMTKPIIVPNTMRLDPLLALLRADGFQMAVVIDEYGGFDGIVTLEDVVEEIVGDIADEHDAMDARIRRRRDGGWTLSGLLRPDEVEDIVGYWLPEHEDYDTVAGLLVHEIGKVPQVGDRVEVVGTDRSNADNIVALHVTLTVESMEGLRVDRIGMQAQEIQEDADDG